MILVIYLFGDYHSVSAGDGFSNPDEVLPCNMTLRRRMSHCTV